MNEKSFRESLKIFAFIAALIVSAGVFSCASADGVVPAEEIEEVTEEQETRRGVPVLIVPSPQKTVYTGEPQPIFYHYEGNAEPEIVYYSSAGDRDEDNGGSAAVPIEAGDYYVRVKRPYENGFGSREEFFVDYRIQKRPVTIRAEQVQAAFYNGDPKRVQAEAEPPVSLSYSYYPNRELMETALSAAREAVSVGEKLSLTETYKGYKRVDRPPIEQGTYCVWILYPGDKNHESAEAFVDFTINPPLPR